MFGDKEEVAVMTAVNCPMGELRFATQTERDWHLRNEHRHAHTHPPVSRADDRAGRLEPVPQPEPEDRR